MKPSTYNPKYNIIIHTRNSAYFGNNACIHIYLTLSRDILLIEFSPKYRGFARNRD